MGNNTGVVTRATLVITFLVVHLQATKAQRVMRDAPILFVESFLGGAHGKAGGLTAGGELNYQTGKSLLTLRTLGNLRLSLNMLVLSPITAIPVVRQKSSSQEFSTLYGLRILKDGYAFSASAGVSYNLFEERYREESGLKYDLESSYLGFPYELNIKWFKSSKKKFRIYGLIPVGRKTSFGGSLGLKVFGNISRNSYTGLSLSYGLGYHKKYNSLNQTSAASSTSL